jgi:hypothetical protein
MITLVTSITFTTFCRLETSHRFHLHSRGRNYKDVTLWGHLRVCPPHSQVLHHPTTSWLLPLWDLGILPIDKMTAWVGARDREAGGSGTTRRHSTPLTGPENCLFDTSTGSQNQRGKARAWCNPEATLVILSSFHLPSNYCQFFHNSGIW